MNIQRYKLKGLLQYFALKETFPIRRRANTNVGTRARLTESAFNEFSGTWQWI